MHPNRKPLSLTERASIVTSIGFFVVGTLSLLCAFEARGISRDLRAVHADLASISSDLRSLGGR